jgi:hypothetical protein
MSPIDVLQIVTANLEQLNLPYMIAGSFASTVYGVPRFTQDADIVVRLSSLNISDVMKTFSSGFYIDRAQIERAVQSGSSFNIIHFESAFKVDLFVAAKDEFEQQALSRRVRTTIKTESQYAPYFQTAEDTILSKLDWFRKGGRVSNQQWRDVLGILKVQEGRLDLAYMHKWAGELQLADLLKEALRDAGADRAQ